MGSQNLPVKLMGTLLQVPGAKVNRQEFLTKVLGPYVLDDEKVQNLQNARPWSIASDKILEAIAKERIAYRKKLVCIKSFLAGLPGGPAMLATIPADVLQYNYHLLILAQELAYLYGFPEFYDEQGNATEETMQALVVMFFGIPQAIGTAGREGVEQLVKMLAKGAPQRIAKMKWGNTVLFKSIQQIAKWLGVKGGQEIGKKEIGKAVGKAIPFLGGLISGGLSMWTFSMDSRRYEEFLRSHKEIFVEADTQRESEKCLVEG